MASNSFKSTRFWAYTDASAARVKIYGVFGLLELCTNFSLIDVSLNACDLGYFLIKIMKMELY